MRDTIGRIYFGDSVMHHLCEARAVLDPGGKRFPMDLMIVMTWRDPDGALAPPEATFDDAGLVAAGGWIAGMTASRPMCPPTGCWYGSRARVGDRCASSSRSRCPSRSRCRNVNDTAAFKEGIMGGAIGVVNAWWDQRDGPSSGLHDTALD